MIQKGVELGADVVQYFPKNPKSYRPKKFSREALQKEAAKVADLNVQTVCHSPYVTNLSTPDPELRSLSIASIINDLEICDAYGTPHLVVHCGKHVGEGAERGKELMVQALDEVLRGFDGQTMILLENTAGQGTELGQQIDELIEIHSAVEQPERIGVCFDTCHAFAAGVLDFDNWDAFASAFTHEDFMSLVKVIHLNDSKVPFGQKRDRHELIGQGEIGSDYLTQFLMLEAVQTKPIVLETPVENEDQYADEMRTVRSWLEA